jgi:hypothetical protein
MMKNSFIIIVAPILSYCQLNPIGQPQKPKISFSKQMMKNKESRHHPEKGAWWTR